MSEIPDEIMRSANEVITAWKGNGGGLMTLIAQSLISERQRAEGEITSLRSELVTATALAKEESERGDQWFNDATYEVGGVPRLWSERATKAEAERDSLKALCDDLAKALERLAELTPRAANAATANDLHFTVKAIAFTALEDYRSAKEAGNV